MGSPGISNIHLLQAEILDILPNPVLVKDVSLRYVFVNRAFETLFSVNRESVLGQLDKDIFKERQAIQCNAGDLRVLESGELDEAYETVFRADATPREIITRKSRLILPNNQVFLVGIIHDITEVSNINRQLEENQKLLQQQSLALEKMAHTDPLTGCSNRRAFASQAPKTFEKYGNVGSLLLLDLDHFKRINDTYGHDAGDAVLVHFVETIARLIREEDNIVRLGGEEFVIVLPNASLEESRFIAERIRTEVESTPIVLSGEPVESVQVTVSIGVVYTPGEKNINLDKMMIKGDGCLYHAKKHGRNQVVCAIYD